MDPKPRDKSDTAEVVPLRPATPIDAEIARPHPEDVALAERAEAEMKRKPQDPDDRVVADDQTGDTEEATEPDKEVARRERATRANLKSSR